MERHDVSLCVFRNVHAERKRGTCIARPLLRHRSKSNVRCLSAELYVNETLIV